MNKPTSFNYCEYAELLNNMQKQNAYVEALKAENIELRAERDALLKSIGKMSEPIEKIEPRGIVE